MSDEKPFNPIKGRLKVNFPGHQVERVDPQTFAPKKRVDLSPRGQLITATIDSLREQGFSVNREQIIRTEVGATIPVEKNDEKYVVNISIAEAL